MRKKREDEQHFVLIPITPDNENLLFSTNTENSLNINKDFIKISIPKEIPYNHVDELKRKIAEDIVNAVNKAGYFNISTKSDANGSKYLLRENSIGEPVLEPGSVVIEERVERVISANERREMVEKFRRDCKNKPLFTISKTDTNMLNRMFGKGMVDILIDAGFLKLKNNFDVNPFSSSDNFDTTESNLKTIQYITSKLNERLSEIINIPHTVNDYNLLYHHMALVFEIKKDMQKIWNAMKKQIRELEPIVFSNDPEYQKIQERRYARQLKKKPVNEV